jgi:diaminohydroxyphosphoribosylaminopyrimidine deaminase/5-amino-6-(5-phosphoribosylamino)uracil reductase
VTASLDHEAHMHAAIAEAERARGKTGDNPWVGCVIVDARGRVVARGHTQGPGEDHAEIGALHEAAEAGALDAGVTLYSTLEPCSFHGRTPACSRVIIDRGVRRVVTGMRDPNPRVDGEGARILRDAGVEVLEGVCEDAVRRQLGAWVLAYHPHEVQRRARAMASTTPRAELAPLLASLYAIDEAAAARVVTGLDAPSP